MPRNKANLGPPIYVRLSPETDVALRAIAAEEEREISEVVRLAVKDYVARRRPPGHRRAAVQRFDRAAV